MQYENDSKACPAQLSKLKLQTGSPMRSDIVEGVNFPDYELPDQDKKRRKLSELQGDDPVALLLARGGYCPKEHLQHQWLAAMQA